MKRIIFAAMLLCAPATAQRGNLTPPATTPPVTTPPATVAPPAPSSTAMQLGINVSTIAYWNDDRAFMNLAIGGGRVLVTAAGAFVPMPADRLDANHDVVALKAGEGVAIPVSLPTAAFRGATVDVTCRWLGSTGSYRFFSPVVTNLKTSTNSATFTWAPIGRQSVNFIYTGTDPKNPVRQIDCRESAADPAALYAPDFLETIKRYSTVRMLNWSFATNNNTPVTWAARNKPGTGAIDAQDGVPIEHMIALANQAKVSPWFTIPWNADAAYVRNMAVLVRDTLDPSLKAHVELSNEVWNYGFGVAHQAQAEGLAKNLSTNGFQANLWRYAEKVGEMMDVWTEVFAGKTSRLVRVVATQNSTWPANNILGFRDTAKKVDALASAPYFGGEGYTAAASIATPAQRDAFFAGLDAKVDAAIANAKLVKGVAVANKIRYLAYEGGQHVLGANGDFGEGHALLQRDPRMGKAYSRYLTGWHQSIGDTLTLFQDVARMSRYGSWGHQEYAGQPLSEAPKAAAVEAFRKANLMAVAPPAVCP